MQEGSPRLCSISGRGRVMCLLFWDKLEPFVTVINRNRHCKPKFVLWFQVCSFILQPVLFIRHCCSIRQLLPWITAFLCHFVMPLIMTVQVSAILYVLRLPRDSIIGSFRQRYPSYKSSTLKTYSFVFQRDSKSKDSRVRGRS